MSDIKELNSKSYEKNSKYHRHTGSGVRHIQKVGLIKIIIVENGVKDKKR